jgi:methylated-DNA-[protein]-cysteine S-methyltransferase
MNLWLEEIETPIGALLVVSDDAAVHAADFADGRERMLRSLQRHAGADIALVPSRRERAAGHALRRYFAGDLLALDDLIVRTSGSAMQRAVWQALRAIPVGTTISYGALAARLGRPSAARAVGMANARNPVALIVPCHRVIGTDGSLTGYAGGVSRKRWLLEHERARVAAC